MSKFVVLKLSKFQAKLLMLMLLEISRIHLCSFTLYCLDAYVYSNIWARLNATS